MIGISFTLGTRRKKVRLLVLFVGTMKQLSPSKLITYTTTWLMNFSFTLVKTLKAMDLMVRLLMPTYICVMVLLILISLSTPLIQ